MGLIHPENLRIPAKPEKRKKLIGTLLRERLNEWLFFIGDHQAAAARAMEIPVSNIYSWKANGRVSPKGALLIEKTWPKSQFKAKYLRPDIIDWDAIENRESAVGRY